LGYIEKTIGYCEGLTFDGFMADSKTVEACVFNLSQMGELVRLYVEELREMHPGVPWHSMYNLRNRIVHDYEGIDFFMIWDIIRQDLPALQEKLKGEMDVKQ
jgi:uncharacterized protein with HEPN domain